MSALTPSQAPELAARILVLRGQRVMLDADLAALYGVTTKRFNEAVRRNLVRFPEDFMFALNNIEWAGLRSQFATLDEPPAAGRGRFRKYLPLAFTEHGALMAASLLNSARAIEVSVYVVRAFVRLRELAAVHGDLAKRLSDLEDRTTALASEQSNLSRETREQLQAVFDALRALKTPPDPPRRPIGFIAPDTQRGKSAKTG